MSAPRSLFLLALCLAVPLPAAHAPYPVDTDLGGLHSRYTDWLVDIARHWPPKHIDYKSLGTSPVRLKCLETPGEKFYIGVEHVMRVAATLEAVDAVLVDVEGYAKLFPGFEKTSVEERDGNRWLAFREQVAPWFFLRNVRSRMTYVVDRSRPGRVMYRYQLKESNRVKGGDGIIVIEAENGGTTRYTALDFFDADYGFLTMLAPGRVWRDSVENYFLSDVAIKLRAEHADWDAPRVRAEAKRLLDAYPLDETLSTRARFPRGEVPGVPVATR